MRLTVAQALVRFLASPVQRARRRRAAADRRAASGSSATATSPASGRRCSSRRDAAALLPGPQRAGDGAHRGRLRAAEEPPLHARLHVLDRPRRDEHGHRRGAGDDQPPPRPAAARRRLRHPRVRHRCCRSSRTRRPTPSSASTTRSSRSRATGTGSSAPSSSRRAAARDARADRPGRDRRGDARAARRTSRPRPSTGPRSCSTSASGASAARSPSPRSWRAPPSDPRGARRPLIVAGGGDDLRRGHRRPARARRGDRHRGRRDAGRQGLAAVRPSAGRWARSAPPAPPRQRARPRGRRRARRRHALERLHDGAPLALRARRALHQPQRRPDRRRPSTPGCRCVADARLGLERSPRRSRASTWTTPRNSTWDATSSAPTASATRAAGAGEVIGVVNRVPARATSSSAPPAVMPGDLHKLWRTRDPKGYHVEYGYSTMGYEIAGGLGDQDGRARPRGLRLVGDGSYLMMAQELVTAVAEGIKLTIVLVQNHGFQSIGALSRVGRLAALRHEVPLPRDGRDAPGRPRRQRRQPRRRRARGHHDRGLRGGAARGGRVAAHDGRADHDRPHDRRARLRGLVGRARWPRSPSWSPRRPPASSTSATSAPRSST